MRRITPPIKGHRGLDFSFPKHTPVFHFLHHGPRNKDRHLNGKQNDPENLEKRVVDQQGNAHKKHKAVDPRPSLSKYGYVKFKVETGAFPGWSHMVIDKGALVNIRLKG